MEKGDAIIHFIDKDKTYQWLYCTKDQDKIKVGFEAGKLESITSTSSFDTKEKAIADLNRYINENHLKKPNIIYGAQK